MKPAAMLPDHFFREYLLPIAGGVSFAVFKSLQASLFMNPALLEVIADLGYVAASGFVGGMAGWGAKELGTYAKAQIKAFFSRRKARKKRNP